MLDWVVNTRGIWDLMLLDKKFVNVSITFLSS